MVPSKDSPLYEMMISQEDPADESNFEIIVEGRVTDNDKTAAITDPNATRLADYANAINQQAGDVVTAAVENGRFVIAANRRGVSLTFSEPNLIFCGWVFWRTLVL